MLSITCANCANLWIYILSWNSSTRKVSSKHRIIFYKALIPALTFATETSLFDKHSALLSDSIHKLYTRHWLGAYEQRLNIFSSLLSVSIMTHFMCFKHMPWRGSSTLAWHLAVSSINWLQLKVAGLGLSPAEPAVLTVAISRGGSICRHQRSTLLLILYILS